MGCSPTDGDGASVWHLVRRAIRAPENRCTSVHGRTPAGHTRRNFILCASAACVLGCEISINYRRSEMEIAAGTSTTEQAQSLTTAIKATGQCGGGYMCIQCVHLSEKERVIPQGCTTCNNTRPPKVTHECKHINPALLRVNLKNFKAKVKV